MKQLILATPYAKRGLLKLPENLKNQIIQDITNFSANKENFKNNGSSNDENRHESFRKEPGGSESLFPVFPEKKTREETEVYSIESSGYMALVTFHDEITLIHAVEKKNQDEKSFFTSSR
ncbi:hypothetical protein J2128_001600 [Methanomicrobium sp. W14]|uniref:hypothetical protein n=1 Tax=Methanomicrobium sp. W14 TaxID=2817839 RepID=UPI001AE9CCD4|nr:hypothetical protein [Methanomicrobium sp. W14]MBP2133646.1 hypothetical protein [Methanomicrobium sp. W14]